MKLDKPMICNLVRSSYPKAMGIRRRLQAVKVKRVSRLRLSEEEIARCEKDPTLKGETIAPCLRRWKRQLRSVTHEMEDILANAPLYADRTDHEELRADMMFCYLAYGFLPSEYVCFELENKTPDERKEFVSDTDTKAFGYSVNDITVMQGLINKGRCYTDHAEYYGRDAVVIRSRKDYGDYRRFIRKHPVFVRKIVHSMCGSGVKLVDISKVGMTEREFFEKLLRTENCMLEEVVKQCGEMAAFNPSSVNTIRCITLKTDRGVIVPWCFMRTGRNGSFVDNGGAGGLVIGVDAGTGIIATSGFDEYNNEFVCHPDTSVKFAGSQIPKWKELLSICADAAAKMQDVNYLSWDLALTDHGWVVIEINEIGQLIGPQMTFKKGIKKELGQYRRHMSTFT